MSGSFDSRTVGQLVGDLVSQFTKLLRNEMAIARAELTAKATEVALGAGLLIGAAVMLIPAIVLLLMALSAWLVELGLRASLSNLIAAVVGLLLGGGLAYLGKAKLNPQHLKPERTMREIERDIVAVKETTR